MKDIKIIVLAGQGESTKLIINGISNLFTIEKIIIESPVQKRQLLIRRVKNLGFAKVFGQTLFMIYNKAWLKNRSKARINRIKLNNNLNDKNINESNIIRVKSINSQTVKKILEKYRPDVVVVNGTRIIKKEIIEAIDVPFLNIHAGITPKYRGVHGGYWALTENDTRHCGVTVHLIDTGIDTGGVLYQDVISITKNDNFNTYPYLQIAAAIPLMKKAIKDVANKEYIIKKIDLPSKLWSHPSIIEYLKYRIFYKVK